MYKTYQPKQKDIKRDWHLINADGQVLGRIATQISIYLMGKHKVSYSNHIDMGDFVVVVNAGKVRLTGAKLKQKVYQKHSGYPGGFKEVKIEKLMKEAPQKVIQYAVFGMLPDNRLKSGRLRRLRIFRGEKHPYEEKLKISN